LYVVAVVVDFETHADHFLVEALYVLSWTTYPVIAEPPFVVGLVHVTVAERSPRTTLTECGAEAAE
jgi:hypothetical protein